MALADVRLGQGRGQSEATGIGRSTTLIARFEPPMQVDIINTEGEREPAKVTFLADVPGYSLAQWCIDRNGEQGFVSVDKLRVRDSNYLPAATPRT